MQNHTKRDKLTILVAVWPFAGELEIPISVTTLIYVGTLTLTFSVSIFVVVWPFVLVAFWQRLSELAQSPWLRVGMSVVLVGIGGLLYLARKYMRSVYGAAEVVLGAATCWNGLGSTALSAFAAMLSVAGGLYIIVRGFDNFAAGRIKRTKDADQR
jgi:hypothetical protein